MRIFPWLKSDLGKKQWAFVGIEAVGSNFAYIIIQEPLQEFNNGFLFLLFPSDGKIMTQLAGRQHPTSSPSSPVLVPDPGNLNDTYFIRIFFSRGRG